MANTGTRNTALSFGDYEISVAMVKAETSRDVKLENVDERTGHKVASGRSGARGGMAARAGVVKALEGTDGRVRFSDEELDAIVQASKDKYETMVVLETLDYRQVDTARIKGSYWLQPRAGTAKGLALLARGLKNTGRVAGVKWVSTSREKLGVIRVRHPFGDERIALLLSELAFANDFIVPDDDVLAINDVEAGEREIAAAERLVKAFARDGEAKVDTASDEAVDARLALVERKQDAELEGALEASVAGLDGELAVRRP